MIMINTNLTAQKKKIIQVSTVSKYFTVSNFSLQMFIAFVQSLFIAVTCSWVFSYQKAKVWFGMEDRSRLIHDLLCQQFLVAFFKGKTLLTDVRWAKFFLNVEKHSLHNTAFLSFQFVHTVAILKLFPSHVFTSNAHFSEELALMTFGCHCEATDTMLYIVKYSMARAFRISWTYESNWYLYVCKELLWLFLFFSCCIWLVYRLLYYNTYN